jgi:polyribonucleotide nucleotidyltransferase
MTNPEENVHETTAVIDNGASAPAPSGSRPGASPRRPAGSVVAYLDDETMLLSATTASKQPKEHFDFFPLTVDVEERMYAIGKIPGSFFRREGRPGTDAILTCRLIDRPLRPSFVDGLRNEIQIVVTVLSLDPQDPYDALAINAASASTQLAGLPFSGPIGGVASPSSRARGSPFPTYEPARSAPCSTWSSPGGSWSGTGRRDHDGGGRGHHRDDHSGRRRCAGAHRDVVASGLEAAKPFIRTLCDAQQQLADVAAKPTRPTRRTRPTSRRLRGRVRHRDGRPGAGAGDRGKQEREARLDEVKLAVLDKVARSSRAARRRSAPRSGR